MSRSSILILLGVAIVLVPLSGIPIQYRSLLTVILGVCVFSFGLSMRTRITHTTPTPQEPTSPAQEMSSI